MIRIYIKAIERKEYETRRQAETKAVGACLAEAGFLTPPAHTEGGAPFLPDHPDTEISVSHSERFAAVAVGDKDDVPFGIDVEDFTRSALLRVTPRIMNESERKTIPCHPVDYARVWTAKEAVFKAFKGHNADFSNDILIYGENINKAYHRPADSYVNLVYEDIGENNMLCLASRRNNFEIITL